MSNSTPPPVPTRSIMTDSAGLATRPWIAWFTTLGHLFGFNQTIQIGGIVQPQELALNFLPPLTVTDNPANGSTDIGLAEAVIGAHDVTGTRSFGDSYQNLTGKVMRIYGYGITHGSTVGSVECRIGINHPPDLTTFADTANATTENCACGFTFEVPAGYWYAVLANTLTDGAGDAVYAVGRWTEVY